MQGHGKVPLGVHSRWLREDILSIGFTKIDEQHGSANHGSLY